MNNSNLIPTHIPLGANFGLGGLLYIATTNNQVVSSPSVGLGASDGGVFISNLVASTTGFIGRQLGAATSSTVAGPTKVAPLVLPTVNMSSFAVKKTLFFDSDKKAWDITIPYQDLHNMGQHKISNLEIQRKQSKEKQELIKKVRPIMYHSFAISIFFLEYSLSFFFVQLLVPLVYDCLFLLS